MVGRDDVIDVLRTVNDPEMPINIVDLGMVGDVRVESTPNSDTVRVQVDLLPTFVGCIALPAIEAEVRRKIAALRGVDDVDVSSRFDPPWTVDRISAAGRESLRSHGITVPGGDLRCPFCNSENVHVDSPFGPARCRMIYYCDACRNVFEHLKPIYSASTAIPLGRISRQSGEE